MLIRKSVYSLYSSLSTLSIYCICKCVLVDGIWGTWTEYSSCNQVCGNGNYTRTRLCDNPENKHGGKACPGPDTDDLEECNVEPCPRNTYVYILFCLKK